MNLEIDKNFEYLIIKYINQNTKTQDLKLLLTYLKDSENLRLFKLFIKINFFSIYVMNKMDKILNHFDLTFDDVFKCLVMIDDINEWSLFNSVYIQYFKKPYPARSAFGADGLAGGASFELECIAIIQDN